MPNPSSVQMHFHIILVCKFRNLHYVFLGENRTIKRVLQCDDLCRCEVNIILEYDILLDIVKCQVMSYMRRPQIRISTSAEQSPLPHLPFVGKTGTTAAPE